MPSHSSVLAPRLPRLNRTTAVALAAACATAGAVTIVIADDQPAPQIRSIAEPSQPVASRYQDLEANKAANSRALSRHIAEPQTSRTVRYQDLEANKAHSQRAR